MSQRFAAEPLANLSKRRSLRIGQPQSRGQVRSEYAVFGSEVFVAQQQLLVNESSYIGTLPPFRRFCQSSNRRARCEPASPQFSTDFRKGFPKWPGTGNHGY